MGHPVPYDWTPFLAARDADPMDDPVLAAWTSHLAADDLAWLGAMAELVRGPLATAADFAEQPANLPRLAGKGPFDNDPQQVVLPAETWEALAAVHGSGIWSPERDARARCAAVYLLNQNGEAGVACSVACTDGLVRVLQRHRGPETAATLAALETATPEQWTHGAQFVTEIQGGSDAATNAMRAEGPDHRGEWALHGQKWFCSNLTADWWLVTARHDPATPGHGGVGLFLVARDQDGYTVERLKEKLGTRALPTAEIMFRGAKGIPIGPLEGGLRTMVADVLVTSRIHNILAAAAFTRRAEREATAYAHVRHAFGGPIADKPLVAASLHSIHAAADLTAAGAFATVDCWLSPPAGSWGPTWARVLVSIAKAVTTRRLPGLVHEAMMIMGGNGVEERFTLLPRLWRDSAILETWEGPYSLLIAQALRDLVRAGVAGHEEAFLAAGLGEDAHRFAPRLHEVLSAPDKALQALAWRDLATDIHATFERRALARLTH